MPQLHLPCPSGTLVPVATGDLARVYGERRLARWSTSRTRDRSIDLRRQPAGSASSQWNRRPSRSNCRWYLSKAVAAWQQQNSMLTVRATLPIVANGNTIAVHVWFE
jgi:hypothetical protein